MTSITLRRMAGLLCAGGLILPALAQDNTAKKMADLFGDPVIVRGEGFEIKRSELDAVAANQSAAAAARGQAVSPDRLQMLEPAFLLDLIVTRIVQSKATEAELAEASKKLNEALAKLKETAKLSEEEYNQNLERQLKLQNLSREEWEEQQKQTIVARIVLERELKINVTDEQVKQYYEENPIEERETARALNIMFLTINPDTRTELPEEVKKAKLRKAEAARERARAGENFLALVREYSEDPTVKDRGGEITLARGGNLPVLKGLEVAAFSLEPNQISDIVTTPLGYHIIKLIERTPAKKLEFEKVSTQIKELLTQRELARLLPDYGQTLLKTSNYEILDARLKAAVEALPPPEKRTTIEEPSAEEKAKE